MSFLSTATEQSLREYQEDRFCAIESEPLGVLLAVMDGHGGSSATSEFCTVALPEMLTRAAQRMNTEQKAEDVLRNVVRGLAHATQRHSSGTTLSVVWMPCSDPNTAIAAVIGDSPIVIKSNGNVFLGPEHNVQRNLLERKAAISRGGDYGGGYIRERSGGYGIQLARALGDSDFGEIIRREPEIFILSDPEWILVGSDGLFAPSHDSEGAEILRSLSEVVHQKGTGASANDFLDWSRNRGGFYDNATAVFWHR